MTRFEAAADIIIGHEGPRSNDPRDAGGLTVFGHDQASWPDLLARVPAGVRAALPPFVGALSHDQAVLAYRAGYWDFVRGDDLPAPLALMVFDAAVNQGAGWVAGALQTALGVPVDGIIGPVTARAAAAADVLDLLGEFTWRRLLRYRQCSNYAAFGHGWEMRAIRTAVLAAIYDDPAAQAVWLPHIGTPRT